MTSLVHSIRRPPQFLLAAGCPPAVMEQDHYTFFFLSGQGGNTNPRPPGRFLAGPALCCGSLKNRSLSAKESHAHRVEQGGKQAGDNGQNDGDDRHILVALAVPYAAEGEHHHHGAVPWHGVQSAGGDGRHPGDDVRTVPPGQELLAKQIHGQLDAAGGGGRDAGDDGGHCRHLGQAVDGQQHDIVPDLRKDRGAGDDAAQSHHCGHQDAGHDAVVEALGDAGGLVGNVLPEQDQRQDAADAEADDGVDLQQVHQDERHHHGDQGDQKGGRLFSHLAVVHLLPLDDVLIRAVQRQVPGVAPDLPLEIEDAHDQQEGGGGKTLQRRGHGGDSIVLRGDQVDDLEAAGGVHGEGGHAQPRHRREQGPGDARPGKDHLGKGQQHEQRHRHSDAAVYQQGAHQHVYQQGQAGAGLGDQHVADPPGRAALAVEAAQQGAQGDDNRPAFDKVREAVHIRALDGLDKAQSAGGADDTGADHSHQEHADLLPGAADQQDKCDDNTNCTECYHRTGPPLVILFCMLQARLSASSADSPTCTSIFSS